MNFIPEPTSGCNVQIQGVNFINQIKWVIKTINKLYITNSNKNAASPLIRKFNLTRTQLFTKKCITSELKVFSNRENHVFFLLKFKSLINIDDIMMVYLSTYAPSAILHLSRTRIFERTWFNSCKLLCGPSARLP